MSGQARRSTPGSPVKENGDFTDNVDLIVLSGLAGYDALTVSQNCNDTLIDWATDSSITLANFDSTLLGAEDFMFI